MNKSRRRTLRALPACTAGLGALSTAAAQPCAPHWSNQFESASLDGHVAALTSFDDGSGPSLFVGGMFENAAGINVSRIARFDGVWHPLASGIPGPFNSHGIFDCCAVVSSLTGTTLGGQRTLTIGGDFIVAGGLIAESIAQWQGSAWSTMAGGMENVGCSHCPPRVSDAIVFDDGTGPALFITGTFTGAGGVATSRIAKWTGAQFEPLGLGLSRGPTEELPYWGSALAVHNDGSGPALYVGGFFSRAGEVEALNMARWDGQAWSAVGGGITQPPGGPTPNVNALAVYNDGSGPALYAAGYFQEAARVPARHIARWNGSGWSPLGAGVGPDVNDQVRTLEVYDDGSGPGLYAGGSFAIAGTIAAANIARWNGSAWSALGSGVDGDVHALTVHDEGAGPALYVGGQFSVAGGRLTPNLAKWVGCTPCYANCDGSTVVPVLNVSDFICFQSRFAAGDSYANCDNSSTPPVLNVSDFICYLTRFSAGCS